MEKKTNKGRTVTKETGVAEALERNWEYFCKGFLVRVTSPMVIGFGVISYLLGGMQYAAGFLSLVGAMGGLRAVRRKTMKDL